MQKSKIIKDIICTKSKILQNMSKTYQNSTKHLMEKYTKKNYNDLRNYYGSFFIE